MTDPTGTVMLRRGFIAEANRRLARLRSLTHAMLVEHDLMHARNDPLAQFLPHPGHRLPAFADWFARTAEAQLVGVSPWWEKYLQRAYDSGWVAGGALAGIPPAHQPLPAVYSELARRELAGIVAALVQQVTRQAGFAGLMQQKPQMMYRQVLAVIQKVGAVRLKAFANFMTVKLHNAARLVAFGAAGISQVGIIPEHLEAPRRSRFLRHDHALIRDELAEIRRKRLEVERRMAELLAEQRAAAREEEIAAQIEAARARAQFEREITAELATGIAQRELTGEQAQAELAVAQAQAEAEVAAAKAATAAREVEAAAAWEQVKAARKEERAAAYAARTAVEREPPPERVARPAAEEVVTRVTVGVPEPPERLAKIGAEFVNVQTAGDDLVCDICEGIADEGPYSLDEAQGLIPAHPNCRCAFVPAELDEQ